MSYYIGGTILITIYTHYGNLIFSLTATQYSCAYRMGNGKEEASSRLSSGHYTVAPGSIHAYSQAESFAWCRTGREGAQACRLKVIGYKVERLGACDVGHGQQATTYSCGPLVIDF